MALFIVALVCIFRGNVGNYKKELGNFVWGERDIVLDDAAEGQAEGESITNRDNYASVRRSLNSCLSSIR